LFFQDYYITVNLLFSQVHIGLNPQKIPSKGFIVLSDSAGHGEFQKKVSINRTLGRGLICIFSKWPPLKPIMYYWLFMI